MLCFACVSEFFFHFENYRVWVCGWGWLPPRLPKTPARQESSYGLLKKNIAGNYWHKPLHESRSRQKDRCSARSFCRHVFSHCCSENNPAQPWSLSVFSMKKRSSNLGWRGCARVRVRHPFASPTSFHPPAFGYLLNGGGWPLL